MEALVAFISKVDNVAILVLVLALAGSGYLHLVWRREEREDRAKLLDLLQKTTDAINGLKMALSVMTGKIL